MTGVAAANSLFIDMVKNFNLIFIVLFGLLSCSEESSPNVEVGEDAIFVDQGTSLYADNNPLNDVLFQAFWWDSFNDPKIGGYSSFYAFLEDQIVSLSNAHIDENLLVKIGSGAYVPDSQWKETRKALAYAVWEK